ncbi:hypothetical protein JW926_18650 [Candidatus Sumerlaeota bacterium]|nr:hypothetical protein [Candidatus Sumerlaeota bacterium]
MRIAFPIKLRLIFSFFIGASLVYPDNPPSQWIVVSPPEFHEELTPLCEYRKNEGMLVIRVNTEVLNEAGDTSGSAENLKKRLHKLCSQSKGENYILLAGMMKEKNPGGSTGITVPGIPGCIGRMKGIATDHGYGIPGSDYVPGVAIGRFPAGNKDEIRAMIQKTLHYEKIKSSGEWRNRIVSLLGNPGGKSLMEKRFAEFFTRLYENKFQSEISPHWNLRIISHSPISPFFISGENLEKTFSINMEEGALFTIYLGHSGADSLFSDGMSFMNTEKWNRLRIRQGNCVFFTCGCFACQYEKEEGYGLTAMRNPGGPVAVIGSFSESYAALGLLAFQGLFAYLNSTPEKARLADYWLSVNRGMANIEMDPFTFFLFDQADGSEGKVPLDVQRKEHLEMWTLLGDPALNIWTNPVMEDF